MPSIVQTIQVDFGSDFTKSDKVGDTCSWHKYPQNREVYVKNPPSIFNIDMMRKYFNKKDHQNTYFNTVAIKQQLLIYDDRMDNNNTFQNVGKRYPNIQEQLNIFKSFIRKLIKDRIVNNLWCVFELHKCNEWVHIHFLSTSKYELESYKRKTKKVFYQIVEEDNEVEFNRDSQNYKKSAFKIEGAEFPIKIYDYMKKNSQLSELAFPEMYYLYATSNNKVRYIKSVIKKNL